MSTTEAGDILVTWVERIAAAAAPDELDLAPDIAVAYVAGGAERRQLFAGPSADPGAFGADLLVVLPHVLDALRLSYETVRGFLGDPAVNAAVSMASLAVAVTQWRAARRPGADAPPADAEPDKPESGRSDARTVAAAQESITAVSTELESCGLEPDRAGTVSVDVLNTLAGDPGAAMAFLEMLRRGRP